ncbi:MAG: hypothetical protein WCP89_00935 [archaeon]
MAGIRNKKLDREDYEFVGGETNTLDREMVRFRIGGRYWRVLKQHEMKIFNEGECQRIIRNYQLVNSLGDEKYLAVTEFFGCIRGMGTFDEVQVISELEDSVEDSRESYRTWLAERTRKS